MKKSIDITKFLITISFLAALLTIPSCDYFFPPLTGDKITVKEAFAYLKKHSSDKDVILLDLRTKEHYDISHIQNAVNLDYSQTDFPAKIEKLDKSKRYIVYDEWGKNGLNTVVLMTELRFPNIHAMRGGFNEWNKENLPLNF